MPPRRSPRTRPYRPVIVTGLLALALASLDAGSERRLSSEAESVMGSITADDLRGTVRELASDAMQGRGVGHAGNARAADHAEAAFARMGVGPANGASYRQPVALVTVNLGDGTRLGLPPSAGRRAGREVRPGADFFPAAHSASGTVEGPVAFIGFGPDVPADDAGCAWPQLGGRILLALDGEVPPPGGAGRDAGARRRTLAQRASLAARCGALALLVAGDEGRGPTFRATWPARVSPATRAVFAPSDVLPLPVAWVSLQTAADLLGPDARGRARRGSRLWDDGVRAARRGAASGDPVLAAGPESRLARVRIVVDTTALDSWNVLGLVEGADRTVEAETVVVGAHLDHDGLDADGVIYNGADDNASGVAAVLEIGEALARAAARGDRPRRAVVLALWNGEEKGLLGSRQFVGAPLPAGRTPVAYVNLDMVGRSEEVPAGPDARFRGLAPTPARAGANAVDLLGYSRTPEMALVVGQESGAVGLEVRERYDTHVQDLLRRSDHWSFLRAGIPAVGFTTGLHPDYHRPTDDADLIDYRKLERVSRLAFRVVWRLADATAAPPPLAASAPTEP